MEWISIKKRLPLFQDADEYGNVLIFRETTKEQKSLSKSIYPVHMVKYCDDNTFWTTLPKNPTNE